jgi:hypothetical protein
LQLAETNFHLGLVPLASIVAIAIGTGLLRYSWIKSPDRSWVWPLAGWSAIAFGAIIHASATSTEIGIAYGFLSLTLVAYAAIALTLEFRSYKGRAPLSAALEPEERKTNWPRAIAKSLLAIVLAGVASIGVGVAFAVAMPFVIHDRVIIGGILVPVLWGAGMAWTLADRKLVRATLLLCLISVAGYAIAFAPKLSKML